jgi:hypothetical protein
MNSEEVYVQEDVQVAQIPVVSFEHFCLFLVAAAEGLFQEPREYGPLRLLQALQRVAGLLAEHGVENPFLSEKAKQVDENTRSVMRDPSRFQEFVSDLVVDFGAHLADRER